MTQEEIQALTIVEQITIKKTGESRDVIGYMDCRCGLVAYVIRGKVKVYEYCTACGNKLANGEANKKYILANMRGTSQKTISTALSVPEAKLISAPEAVVEKVEGEFISKDDIPSKPQRNALIRITQTVLEFELFSL